MVKGLPMHLRVKNRLSSDASFLSPTAEDTAAPSTPHPREDIQEAGPDLSKLPRLTKRQQCRPLQSTPLQPIPPLVHLGNARGKGGRDGSVVSLVGSAVFVEIGDFLKLVQGAKKNRRMPVRFSAGCVLTANTPSSFWCPYQSRRECGEGVLERVDMCRSR